MTSSAPPSTKLTHQEAELAILQDRLPEDFDQWSLTDHARSSLPHLFVVCHGRLPKNFSDWGYKDRHGQTIAETYLGMRLDPLPADFTQWDLPINNDTSTIAHCVVELERQLPATFEAWDLRDSSGRTVIALARELNNTKVIAQYESWVLCRRIDQPRSESDKLERPLITHIHRGSHI